MNALLVGRFHAITAAMEAWLKVVAAQSVERLCCVVTSADQAETRRNPMPVEVREQMLRATLERLGKPFDLVRVDDVPDRERWVPFVLEGVNASLGRKPSPRDTTVFSQNRDVAQLFMAEGFEVDVREATGLTPIELISRVVDGKSWEPEATEATRQVLSSSERVSALKRIYTQRLVNEDGELGHQRDFNSYGAQMDASLQQKLDDLLPHVKPGCIVDKGCGTGKLLVELSRRFPKSAFVGVDLSREFLRRCDENTYQSEQVDLVLGNIIERNVPPGSASTVIFSSVTHEIYSYTGYSLSELARALKNAADELQPGGQLVMRDGVSPGQAHWRLKLLDDETISVFERFAKEFKHDTGAPHERLGRDTVRLSAHLANEFLCKKDYLTNWHIEVNEEYGALTLDGWREALLTAGLQPVELRAYVNPWIARNRYEGRVALFDDAGAPMNWPATNCVVVGRKAD